MSKKITVKPAAIFKVAKALSALLLAGIMTISFVSCSDDANSPDDTEQDIVENSSDDAFREEAAVSTMYADSFEDAFGGVSKITIYAKDNPGLPYDVVSHMERKDQTLYLFIAKNQTAAETAIANLIAAYEDLE